MRKRILSGILTIALVFGNFNLTAYARADEKNGEIGYSSESLSILSTQPDSQITFDFGAYLQSVEEGIRSSENLTDTKNEEAASLVQDFLSEIPGQTYTGKAVKPVIRVYDNKVALKQNKDYKITYKNNINVNQVQKSEIYKE
ncbi:MAG: hypothetical protein IKW28_08585, partial [Lachnospiraceae bacterium]|nr:hypothetical protein [Lachnospiraceae bacterium]